MTTSLSPQPARRKPPRESELQARARHSWRAWDAARAGGAEKLAAACRGHRRAPAPGGGSRREAGREVDPESAGRAGRWSSSGPSSTSSSVRVPTASMARAKRLTTCLPPGHARAGGPLPAHDPRGEGCDTAYARHAEGSGSDTPRSPPQRSRRRGPGDQRGEMVVPRRSGKRDHRDGAARTGGGGWRRPDVFFVDRTEGRRDRDEPRVYAQLSATATHDQLQPMWRCGKTPS